eukprot:SAG22_NODE_205_length_15308_cov_20.539023_9_plen_66_part_00
MHYKAVPVLAVCLYLQCQLPLDEVGKFAGLFAELEARQAEYGFESYGIGITTMEEVFLPVAENGA